MLPSNQAFLLAGLFLLIAAAGWLFGRFGEHRGDDEEKGSLSSDYLRGLNFLLNEQTDQALELFLRVVSVDDDTLETHFALGSLFRRRGEVDRAIRIHQNIIARPNLQPAQRDQAMHSLAKDYLHAGLLDRAEKMFESLADKPAYREEALGQLCRIYEQERDWEKAIAVGERLEGGRAGSLGLRVPHYYCELVEQAMARGELQRAHNLLKKVQDRKRFTVRGALARAEIATAQGDARTAIRLYRRLLDENPDYLVEVLPRLAALLEETNQSDLLQQEVGKLLQKRPESGSGVAFCAILHGLDGPVVDQCVERFILNEPTLAAFVAAQELAAASPEARAAAIGRIREGLAALARKSPSYRCKECGFSSMQLLWQCPSCKAWETQRPTEKVRFDSLLRRSDAA